MTKHEIFAQFFTNLLLLDDRQQARDVGRRAWPATHDMWIGPMKIDGVLVELRLARVMDDGRVGYLMPDRNLGWRHDEWEIEEPTPEQERGLRASAGRVLTEDQERRVVLQDGTEVSWGHLKRLAARAHVWFQVPGDRSRLSFRMGPDHFVGSFVLAWLSPEEKAGTAPYLDRRCRSSEPDDFLSRIRGLVRFFLGEETT